MNLSLLLPSLYRPRYAGSQATQLISYSLGVVPASYTANLPSRQVSRKLPEHVWILQQRVGRPLRRTPYLLTMQWSDRTTGVYIIFYIVLSSACTLWVFGTFPLGSKVIFSSILKFQADIFATAGSGLYLL